MGQWRLNQQHCRVSILPTVAATAAADGVDRYNLLCADGLTYLERPPLLRHISLFFLFFLSVCLLLIVDGNGTTDDRERERELLYLRCATCPRSNKWQQTVICCMACKEEEREGVGAGVAEARHIYTLPVRVDSTEKEREREMGCWPMHTHSHASIDCPFGFEISIEKRQHKIPQILVPPTSFPSAAVPRTEWGSEANEPIALVYRPAARSVGRSALLKLSVVFSSLPFIFLSVISSDRQCGPMNVSYSSSS